MITNAIGRHFNLEKLPGTQLPAVDFCGLAQAQGVAAVRVTKVSELEGALTAAFRSRVPMLVEVVTEECSIT